MGGMTQLLYRLGRSSVRHRRRVLGAWLGALVVVAVLASAAGGETTESLTIPGTESQEAADLLEERFPGAGGAEAVLVFAAAEETTLADPDRMRRFVSFVNAPGVPDPSIRFTPERDQIKPDLVLLATEEELLAALDPDNALLETR